MLIPLLAVPAQPVQGEGATIDLIAESKQAVPGETLTVAIRMVQEPHWHVYWINPGASGLPMELEWTLPEGVRAGEIQWPGPERFDVGGLVSYAYENTVLFLVPIEVPADFAANTLKLKVQAEWLICKDFCLPDEAELNLALPVAAVAEPSVDAEAFAKARADLPKQDGDWQFVSTLDAAANQWILTVSRGAGALIAGEDLYFYAEPTGLTNPDAPQAVTVLENGSAQLAIELDVPFFETNPQSIKGLLQYGHDYWEVTIPVDGESAAAAVVSADAQVVDPESEELVGFEQKLLNLGLGGWLLLAFLGGLILNVMPCVLPVLSLKVFSLLKHSGQSKRHAIAHGVAYTAGVVVCFLSLAGLLFALRAGGELVGWGFQLQSPGFMLALGVLFFVFGLNLMGVFEIGMGLVGADAKVAQRNDVMGSFGMGVLAAVVGAPCIGPLLAGVSGVAIQASVVEGLLVFGTMGFGLASPFLLFAIFPKLIAFMPKPGAWMETVKQVMGFSLMLAVIAVAWVVGQSGGVNGILILMVVLLLAAVGAWIYGRWGALVKPKATQRIALVLALVAILGGTVIGGQQLKVAYVAAASEVKTDGAWATWSPERVEAELAQGNPVFVDFTASWCAICQANKIPLRSDEITELFEARGVVSLEADWTLRDSVIAKVLEDYDRAGVPLYLLYNADGEVTVLPQSLTKGNIRGAVEKHLD